jgi:hypothetical protein
MPWLRWMQILALILVAGLVVAVLITIWWILHAIPPR